MRVQHKVAVSLPRLIKVYVYVDVAEPNFRPVITVKNSDPECIKSTYFWLAPQFHKPWAMADSDHYLINKDNSPGEFIRFTPNLVAGDYEVELYGIPYQNEMLMKKTGGFFANVYYAHGTDRVWVEPAQSLKLGQFTFSKGRNGPLRRLPRLNSRRRRAIRTTIEAIAQDETSIVRLSGFAESTCNGLGRLRSMNSCQLGLTEA